MSEVMNPISVRLDPDAVMRGAKALHKLRAEWVGSDVKWENLPAAEQGQRMLEAAAVLTAASQRTT